MRCDFGGYENDSKHNRFPTAAAAAAVRFDAERTVARDRAKTGHDRGSADPPVKPGEKSILAVIALVISIVSAGLFLLFFAVLANARPSSPAVAVALFLQFLPLSVAIICGHCANTQIRRNPTLSGKGLALAALIIGYIVLAPVALLFIAAVADS